MLRLDWNMVWTIVNLIVLYLLMRRFLIGPVTGIMEKRKALMERQLEEAGASERTANELKAQYEQKLQSAKEESAVLLEQARTDAKAEYDRIISDANSQAGRIIESARISAGQEEEKALREVESKIAGLVIAAAAKVVAGESGEAGNQALYDKYIAKAGGENDADGR